MEKTKGKEKDKNEKKEMKSKEPEKTQKVKHNLQAASKELAAAAAAATNKKRKEQPVVYVPSEKGKIEHIFTTPETKEPKVVSPCPSVTSLSSKDKANQRLAELTALLESNDADSDDSSSAATDLEELLGNIPKNDDAGEKNDHKDDEDQEEEQDDEDEDEDQSDEDPRGQ